MPIRLMLLLTLSICAGVSTSFAPAGPGGPATAPPGRKPAPAAPEVTELSGPLVIAGGETLTDNVRDAFFALAGKEAGKIVVIPTTDDAANDDAKAPESVLKPWADQKPSSVALLRTRDRAKANDPAFVKPLAEATGVWFTGRDQAEVIKAYRGTLVEKELKRLHARGGAIGGTAVVADRLLASQNDGDASDIGLGLLRGFVVDARFSSPGRLKLLQKAVAANPAFIGLGIGEGAAVVVRDRRLRVIGDGKVTVCVAAGAGKEAVTQPAKSGDLFDLFQLRRAAANRAAKDPFPPAKPHDPVVERGSLVIVGGGGAGPEIWKKFIELAGGPDAPIVMIPTALEDPLPPVPGEVTALKRFGARHVEVLHTRSRKEADDPKFSEVLTKAKGVWFGGGRQWRFVDSYEGTLTEKRIHEVLARGGVIGGSSAGASIQSEYMPRGHPLGNTVMAAEGYERGFGFLAGCAVDQHFFARKRTADMTGLMKTYPQYLGIGIDEGTAVVVTKSTAEVIGKSNVAFYDYRRKLDGEKDYEEVAAGGRYDLKERKRLK